MFLKTIVKTSLLQRSVRYIYIHSDKGFYLLLLYLLCFKYLQHKQMYLRKTYVKKFKRTSTLNIEILIFSNCKQVKRSTVDRLATKLSLLPDQMVKKITTLFSCLFNVKRFQFLNLGDTCVEVIEKCSCTPSCYRAQVMEHIYDYTLPIDETADGPTVKVNTWTNNLT